MRYEWHLESLLGKPDLHLIWNPETGEIGGEGGAEIERLIAEYEEFGTISTHPIPSAIDATDIRHSPVQMAAMLYLAWKLPEELKPFYPIIDTAPHTGDGPRPVY